MKGKYLVTVFDKKGREVNAVFKSDKLAEHMAYAVKRSVELLSDPIQQGLVPITFHMIVNDHPQTSGATKALEATEQFRNNVFYQPFVQAPAKSEEKSEIFIEYLKTLSLPEIGEIKVSFSEEKAAYESKDFGVVFCEKVKCSIKKYHKIFANMVTEKETSYFSEAERALDLKHVSPYNAVHAVMRKLGDENKSGETVEQFKGIMVPFRKEIIAHMKEYCAAKEAKERKDKALADSLTI